MPHHTPLIATIVVGLTLAFILGAFANRLKISPIAGYLLAGVVVGPFTPGFVADQALANELAEIGIILLMFGVGLHFSIKDLLAVRSIAIPGAIGQMAVATLLGWSLAYSLGWPLGSGLIFGLALSVASTVVLLRALQERRLVSSDQGRIAVGWLIVEDLVMVLALVLLPALAPLLPGNLSASSEIGHEISGILTTIAWTMGKVIAFVAFMLVIGQRVIPKILHSIAHTGSRELFRLGVLVIALGVAYGAANLFGISFALGAFFAGMILSESELSQRAANETLPLRDAFAVLFFVSVGMLFNPAIVFEQPGLVLATVAIIVLGKSVAALGIVLAFGHPLPTALLISASLAQIGEFSFILAGLGIALGLLSEVGRDLVLAGALISILLNPLLFVALDWQRARLATQQGPAPAPTAPVPPPRPRVLVVGYGRVGTRVATRLSMRGHTVEVVDERSERIEAAKRAGLDIHPGRAPAAFEEGSLSDIDIVVIAIPDVYEAGHVTTEARKKKPELTIIARGHTEAEAAHLSESGADHVITGAEEIADAMVEVVGADMRQHAEEFRKRA